MLRSRQKSAVVAKYFVRKRSCRYYLKLGQDLTALLSVIIRKFVISPTVREDTKVIYYDEKKLEALGLLAVFFDLPKSQNSLVTQRMMAPGKEVVVTDNNDVHKCSICSGRLVC